MADSTRRRPPSNPTTGRITGSTQTRQRLAYQHGQQGAPQAGQGQQPGPQRTPRTYATQQGSQAASRSYNTVVLGKGTSGSTRTYHRIVLAEFVIAVVLVGLSPVLTPRKGTKPEAAAAGAAVTLAGPLVRLTAVCVVFFVLALMATGAKAGRVAAAFGALVVLGVLLNATDEIGLLAKALTGGQAPTAPASANASPAGATPPPAGVTAA